MRAVLVSNNELTRDLETTVLFRSNFERLSAGGLADVRRLAGESHIDVVVVDSALPGAPALVTALRQDPITRPMAIVALGRSDFGLAQLELLQAGANAILPLPPGSDWDDRLMRLVHVPTRKATRLRVDIGIEGGLRGGIRFGGRMLNVSVHGVLVECEQPLQIGDDLRLEFELPGGLGRVCATGTVIRQAAPYRFGVEMTHVESDGRIRIKRHVESPAD